MKPGVHAVAIFSLRDRAVAIRLVGPAARIRGLVLREGDRYWRMRLRSRGNLRLLRRIISIV